MKPANRPPVDDTVILNAATSLGLIGSGADSLARLMRMLCDPGVSGAEIAALIENHPVLCARVLRVANSAYYGQQRTITTIKQAVPILGLSAIRGVAAAVCIDRAAPRRTDGEVVNMSALLRHSLATAVGADSLAKLGRTGVASEAFIAGVLHNLGVPVQVCIDPTGVTAMATAFCQSPTQSVRLMEADHVCVDHEACGASVLDAWQLPDSLVAVAMHHHEPGAAPAAHRTLVSLVNLSSSLALATGHTFPLEPAHIAYDEGALAQLGLAREALEELARGLPERVENLRRALLGS